MGELDSIVLMALNIDPDMRYQSAADFANDLQKFLDGLPVTAHHGNVAHRSVKLIKRRWTRLAVLVCFLALAGFGIFQWMRTGVIRTEIAEHAAMAPVHGQVSNEYPAAIGYLMYI